MRAGHAGQPGNVEVASGQQAATAVAAQSLHHVDITVAANVLAGPTGAASAVKAATGGSGPDAAHVGRIEQG
ncbi:hypothetical protein [Rugamonas apoptosis]|uniref:Uncharacterized protein n=1 Tax=Rugamonas apoptosis TaxID=2758570 RepID=A0A7W2FAI6_9BURK|nr:hypothetical protein [Rugamonas apoptosis]MBA5688162.1 hypothetical protein [Rugamonas apoptosis]